jgi:hypothetical protein
MRLDQPIISLGLGINPKVTLTLTLNVCAPVRTLEFKGAHFRASRHACALHMKVQLSQHAFAFLVKVQRALLRFTVQTSPCWPHIFHGSVSSVASIIVVLVSAAPWRRSAASRGILVDDDPGIFQRSHFKQSHYLNHGGNENIKLTKDSRKPS